MERGLKGTDDLISRVDLESFTVIDIGTCFTKVGLSGVENPKFSIPTCMAKPRLQNETDFSTNKLYLKNK